MTLNVLVDYGNLQPMKGKSRLDTALRLESVIEDIVSVVKAQVPNVEEMHIGFYGGWINEHGQFSPVAEWLLAFIPKFRGRRSGVRILPRLATAAFCHPEAILVGTIREDTNRQRQKMVDGLMIIDSMTLALRDRAHVCLVSDDDDIVPGVLATRMLGTVETYLLRTTNRPVGLNDLCLQQVGAKIHSGLKYVQS